MKICSVQGCGAAHKARGLCNKHYRRLLKRGTVESTHTPSGVARTFFEQTVLCYQGDTCLEWPYAKGSNGYRKLCIAGIRVEVHRLVCEKCHGPAPTPKHEVAHSCGNRSCVNPGHLRWVTSLENSQDMRIHGTVCAGESHPCAKLTGDDVRQIRELRRRETQEVIAAQFGVSRQTVSLIHCGKRWV